LHYRYIGISELR